MNKPIDLSSHPILQQAFDVIQAIEKCGASVELTNAVTKTGELMTAINELIAIRELKGEQVPVRYMAEWSNQYGGMEYDYSEVRSEMDEVAAEHDGNVVELFTAPQKPVVLPPLASIHSNWSGEYLDKADVIAAIEAAGGIVKDSE